MNIFNNESLMTGTDFRQEKDIFACLRVFPSREGIGLGNGFRPDIVEKLSRRVLG